MVVRIADLMAAEEALDQAVEAQRAYQSDDRGWSGHEALDRDGRKHLHLTGLHFQTLERLRADVAAAENQLRALQRSWGS